MNRLEKLKKQIAEWEKTIPEKERKDARVRFIVREIFFLDWCLKNSKKLEKNTRISLKELQLEKDVPSWQLYFLKRFIEKFQKNQRKALRRMKSLFWERDILTGKKKINPNAEITDEMIERAREQQIKPLTEQNQNVIKCLEVSHNDKTASMQINDKFYYCHGCHVSGNAIDFLMNYRGYDFKSAVKYLQHG